MFLRKKSAGLGSPPGEGNSNPLQYSCLGNPMVGSGKNQIQVSDNTAASYITQHYRFHLFLSVYISGIFLTTVFILYWGIGDLQCGVCFRSPGQWFSYTYICMYTYTYMCDTYMLTGP